MEIFQAIGRKPKGHVLKSYNFLLKIAKIWKNDLTKLQN